MDFMDTNGHKSETLHDILSRIGKLLFGSEPDAEPTPPEPANGLSPRSPHVVIGHAPDATTATLPTPQAHHHHQQPVTSPTTYKREPVTPQYRGTDRIIRPELNVEKYASVLFVSPHAKDLHKEKTKAWKIERADGTYGRGAITVKPYDDKRPTTSTHKVLLTLEKLQEEKGTDVNGRTVVSLRESLEALGWKHGGRQSDRLVNELYRARFAPHILQGAFEDEDGDPIEFIDTFTYLDDLKIVRKDRRTKEQYFDPLVAFRFHELIRNRLAHNKTKPTNFDVLVSGIKGENAHVVYTKLDPILAKLDYRKPYQIRAKKLFLEDLLLDGVKYERIGGRKQQLERITDELDEKPLSTGILRCRTAKTRDGTDYKLVAWKIQFSELEAVRHSPPANSPKDTTFIVGELNRLLKVHDPARFKLFAHKYPLHPILYQAMREYQADAPPDHNPLKYFQTILHRIAHQYRRDWIRPCTSDCPQRSQ